MRNDLIIFDFQNDGGGEVLLKPDIVPSLARVLYQAFASARNAGIVEDNHSLGEIQIWLAATERGSIRIAFRALFHPDDTQDVDAALITSNLAADLLTKLVNIILKAGVALTALYAWGVSESETKQPVVTEEQAESFRHVYDELLAIGYSSGATRVLISFPDQTTMALAIDPDLHAGALGSSAPPINDELLGPVEGELRPTTTFVDARMGDQPVKLYMGQLTVKGSTFPVMFRWNSQRPLPSSNEMITVRGRLASFKALAIRPLTPVTKEYRSAAAFLDVYKQVVAE